MKSRSVSLVTFSRSWPVCLARISSSSAAMRTISLAWISMSTACPSPAVRLVDQHRECGRAKRLPWTRRPAADRRGGGGLAHHDRGHVGLDVLHRVVDREQRRDDPARRVDVQVDVLVGVLGLQVQQLRHDQVADLVVDRGAQEDDALLQQPRVDVERALAAARLLDDHRHQVVVGVDCSIACSVMASPRIWPRLVLRSRPRWFRPRRVDLGALDEQVERLPL